VHPGLGQQLKSKHVGALINR